MDGDEEEKATVGVFLLVSNVQPVQVGEDQDSGFLSFQNIL